jgi:transposase
MGHADPQRTLFYQLSLETFVPPEHPRRAIRPLIEDAAIRRACRDLYAPIGRPSIPPEQVFLALVGGYLLGIPSERKLVMALQCNMALRWFVGLNLDQDAWDASTFSQNRRRRFDEAAAARPGHGGGGRAPRSGQSGGRLPGGEAGQRDASVRDGSRLPVRVEGDLGERRLPGLPRQCGDGESPPPAARAGRGDLPEQHGGEDGVSGLAGSGETAAAVHAPHARRRPGVLPREFPRGAVRARHRAPRRDGPARPRRGACPRAHARAWAWLPVVPAVPEVDRGALRRGQGLARAAALPAAPSAARPARDAADRLGLEPQAIGEAPRPRGAAGMSPARRGDAPTDHDASGLQEKGTPR